MRRGVALECRVDHLEELEEGGAERPDEKAREEAHEQRQDQLLGKRFGLRKRAFPAPLSHEACLRPKEPSDAGARLFAVGEGGGEGRD